MKIKRKKCLRLEDTLEAMLEYLLIDDQCWVSEVIVRESDCFLLKLLVLGNYLSYDRAGDDAGDYCQYMIPVANVRGLAKDNDIILVRTDDSTYLYREEATLTPIHLLSLSGV